MLDQTFNDQYKAVVNLAAVDHGGQKALCARGGPSVSVPAVSAAASICRPSTDSNEARSLQLLIRGRERSRRCVDRHTRVKWGETNGTGWQMKRHLHSLYTNCYMDKCWEYLDVHSF